MNDENYNQLKDLMAQYEQVFDISQNSSLFNMIDLYQKVSRTHFHDITSAIELWIWEYASEDLFNYLISKKSNAYSPLIKMVEIIL